MEFETIKKNKTKQVVIGGICAIGVISIGVLATSRAKYRTTESFNIVNGTINYRVPDLNVVAMYTVDEENNEESISTIPTDDSNYTYTLNTSKSACTVNGENINASIEYTDGELYFGKITKKGTKCSIYFDKVKVPEGITSGDIVAGATAGRTSFTGVETGAGGLYSIADSVYGGTSYYYRGAVTNNYVKFGGFCWRIIRFNGDGSIRMIYDGTTCHANGTSTTESLINTGLAYNTAYNDNAYVGYMKGINNTGNSTSYATAHANNYDSTIKAALDAWYDSKLKTYESYISETAGFCNDRKISSVSRSGYGTLGYGKNATAYAPTDRVLDSGWSWLTTQKPSLGCTNMANDLFTPNNSNADNKGNKKLSRPIGLITIDEVIFAGGFGGKANQSYYLYNGNYYWTMSPRNFDGSWAWVFAVYGDGNLGAGDYVGNNTPGVRPVINLRADTVFSSGDGSQSLPFTVQ